MFDDLSESELKLWIEDSLKEGVHTLASGYQGQTLKYESPQHKLVIKTPHGRGLVKKFHVFMMRHEYKAYQRLSALKTVPKCYGIVDRQYLVLQYVDAQPIRHLRPVNDKVFFQKLFDSVKQMHVLGISHFDLKKKDNLLVLGEDTPCIVDFGVAIIKKSGFHPLNAYLFRLGILFDYNGWIKHKYYNRFDEISEDDAVYCNRTFIELLSQKAKSIYKKYIRDYIRNLRK